MKSPGFRKILGGMAYIHKYRCFMKFPFFLAFLSLSQSSLAQPSDTLIFTSHLKKLSLEELMNVEVTSVSKRLQKLQETASGIQVITNQDILSSGAKTLPEALRLASNLQVAQVNASQWAISARGFNNVLANKLLVLVDGRTVYTPLYAGVFWDAQNVVLEDIDRIEVISGPGGALWGANAVNGVINIITKSSAETKGLFVEGLTGTGFPALASLRYGGEITKNLSCRIYGTGFRMGNTFLKNGLYSGDDWRADQRGARIDWTPTANDDLSIQANMYDNRPDPDGGKPVVAKGDNATGRWAHRFSEKSDFQIQVYYDHTFRDFRNGFIEDLKTYDLDWQHKYQFGERNVFTYGLGFRLMDHTVQNLGLFSFLPDHMNLRLYNTFVQDEIILVKEKLRLTLGSKIEHNSYTGFEYQPNARLALTPSAKQTFWAAVSRAVRTPSRLDRDFFLYFAPNAPVILGGNFKSEYVISYEAGWRSQPIKTLSVSLATFYNVYDNLRTAEAGSSKAPFFPITIGNGVRGETYGIELSGSCQPTDWLQLRGGYTHLKKSLWVKENSRDLNKGTVESDDPEHQIILQSIMTLPAGLELGGFARYVDKLPKPAVPAYFELDVRIAWKLNKVIELSIIGQNLLSNHHLEFIPSSPSPREIPKTINGKIICRL